MHRREDFPLQGALASRLVIGGAKEKPALRWHPVAAPPSPDRTIRFDRTYQRSALHCL
ncbi:MAG: hypothetical protein CPSOU_4473 [uncultured Paraburkholderia sp.]|nr:MAG: hypothetical protein CPSOU_4473 [uncultured Paraburkholderia sp.]